MLTALAVLLVVVFAYVIFSMIMRAVVRRQTFNMLEMSVKQFRTATGILLMKKFEGLGEARAISTAANTANYLFAAERDGDKFFQQNREYIRNAALEALENERLREAVGVEMAAETIYAAVNEGTVPIPRGQKIFERSNELDVYSPSPEDLGGSVQNREHVLTMLRLSKEFLDYATDAIQSK